MPVSPADFEFYSRMTGQPIPNTPAGRMAIAPQVYKCAAVVLVRLLGFLVNLEKQLLLLGQAQLLVDLAE